MLVLKIVPSLFGAGLYILLLNVVRSKHSKMIEVLSCCAFIRFDVSSLNLKTKFELLNKQV